MNGNCSRRAESLEDLRVVGRMMACVAALMLVVNSAAGAQLRSGQVGLGVGIGSSSLFGLSLESVLTPTAYVPIMAGDRLMIEPSIGLLRVKDTDDEFEETTSILSLGIGVLFLISADNDGHFYFGPRIGMLRVSESRSGPGPDFDESNTHPRIAGVIGGQFFLRPRFSLGGEIGLSWLNVDEDDDDDEFDNETSVLSTIAEFRIRWYFR